MGTSLGLGTATSTSRKSTGEANAGGPEPYPEEIEAEHKRVAGMSRAEKIKALVDRLSDSLPNEDLTDEDRTLAANLAQKWGLKMRMPPEDIDEALQRVFDLYLRRPKDG